MKIILQFVFTVGLHGGLRGNDRTTGRRLGLGHCCGIFLVQSSRRRYNVQFWSFSTKNNGTIRRKSGQGIVSRFFTNWILSYGRYGKCEIFNNYHSKQRHQVSKLIAGPFVSALANRYGFRLVAIMGSFISSGAFVLTYFATSIEFMYFSYGILGKGQF